MPNPIIRIHDSETNEVIDREMTDEEFAELKARKAALIAKEQEEAAKAAARIELLSKLGLTEDEAKLLLS